MTIQEVIIKIISALFSIGAILLVLYVINKKALKKAQRMNEEFTKLEAEQKEIEKQNKKQEKKEKE